RRPDRRAAIERPLRTVQTAELVDLDQVRMAVDRHRDRGLGDADFGPRRMADNAHLRVLLALLDLADIENGEPSPATEVRNVGDVEAVPVVADVHAVA